MPGIELRRLVFVTHRYLGLVMALFLLIAAVTGCLLVFRGGLDAALNPALFAIPARPVLPALDLVQRLQQAHPDWRIQSFDLQTQPGHVLHVGVGALHSNGHDAIIDGADQVFVDPADARVVGMRGSGAGIDRPHLFQAIYLLHYTLLAGTPGRWLMGIMAFAWLASNGLGVWITWPRRRPWLAGWRPAWGTTRARLDRRPMPELHRVGGLWLLVPLTILATTSVAMNFYDELFRPLVEMLSPPRVSPFDRQPATPASSGPTIGFATAERIAVETASKQTPSLAPVAMTDDPAHDFYDVGFAPDGTSLYENFGRVTYSIDRRTGHVAWIDQPRLDGTGRLVLRALYPLHSGQVFGLPTRLLVLLLGVVTAGLAITGFLPWWRRLRTRRRQTRSRTAEHV
ncbi:MAG: PepSY-associated TM helix domain-containing protein [Janthinobacterium lividum]